jgi:hypothetical protein
VEVVVLEVLLIVPPRVVMGVMGAKDVEVAEVGLVLLEVSLDAEVTAALVGYGLFLSKEVYAKLATIR